MNVPKRLAGRARVAAEAGLGILFVAALVDTAAALAASWGGRYWLFDCAAGAVAGGIALARRRHRLWTAVAGLTLAAVAILVARSAGLPAEPGPAMALALSVLVGSAIRTLPARSAAAIAVAGLAIVVGAHLAFPPSSGIGVGAVPGLNALGWLAALACGLGLRLLAARRRAVAERVRRDERLELARELHDVVAHHITGIVVQAQAAQIVARRHPERAGAALAGIESAGSDALAAMRRVVGLLRDADDAAPTSANPEQLGDLVRRFEGHGPAVRLRLPDGEDTSTWPPEVTSTVHRVVRESLTNVARHAPHARSVTVTVARDRSAVTVEVVDDAPPGGTRYPHRAGYGLIGMRERLEALGGTLRAGPCPDAGWAVRASVPVPAGSRR
ncbi:histidine kinase [Plantactinospora sp. KLBMP9567]|uniref:sensor histidine kinase n=1 Tax=Plantactinospora sp. KLBMP9567 TaxID=3085900 RepID=UPI002981790B|nr:histidine kinase [Plantactinospora sp. KLBMP9567]MDW5326631.1 histidine kinase [Plantactinospora sp. KLBMP9567]